MITLLRSIRLRTVSLYILLKESLHLEPLVSPRALHRLQVLVLVKQLSLSQQELDSQQVLDNPTLSMASVVLEAWEAWADSVVSAVLEGSVEWEAWEALVAPVVLVA